MVLDALPPAKSTPQLHRQEHTPSPAIGSMRVSRMNKDKVRVSRAQVPVESGSVEARETEPDSQDRTSGN